MTATDFTERLSLGERLNRTRAHARLSQAEMGRQLGVSTRAINYWEHDEREPKISVLMHWAIICRVSVRYLAEGALSEEEARRAADTIWSAQSKIRSDRELPQVVLEQLCMLNHIGAASA